MEDFGTKEKKMVFVGVIVLIALLVAVPLFSSWFFVVGAGQVGVTFNSITGTTESYSQGMYTKLPFVTSVVDFDVKTIKLDVKPADSASKDLQKVYVHVVLNYHLDYTKVNTLYVKVGKDYQDKVIVPAVNESVKATTAQFPVEDIIIKREKVKESIKS